MSSSVIQTPTYQARTTNITNADGSPISNNLVTGTVITDSSLMFRNRIINGDMRIDQRNSGASVSAVDQTYCLDRWKLTSWDSTAQTSKYSVQRNAGAITPPAGYTNYLGATSTAATSLGANAEYHVAQLIEGHNVSDLAWGTSDAKTVTLSFWVRSSLTGSFGGAVMNSNVTRSYPFLFTINAANTWEYKTITIAGDTSGTWIVDTGIGMRVTFGLGVGSSKSGTAGAWSGSAFYSATGATSVVGTNGATFYLTGVQLEVGSKASSFERRPYSEELARCQRYCYTYVGTDGIDAGSNYTKLGLGFARTATLCDVLVSLPTMRAAPTFADSGAGTVNLIGSSTYGGVNTTIAATNVALEIGSVSNRLCLLRYTVAGGLQPGQCYLLEQNNTQTKKQLFFAEL
jgi:hypothetical protein